MMKEVRNDILYSDGCDTMELAKKYGTPFYVISAKGIKDRFEELRNCFTEKYSGARVAYAAKAFFPFAMARLVAQEGMCVDVVSGGELYTAIKAGFPAERIEFNGNNKLREELDMAIEYGVGRIIVDGFTELDRKEEICREKVKKANVLFRLTPGIDCHSHDYMVTAKLDSKFGFSMDEDNLIPKIQQAIESEWIELKGFHFHVGSQIFDNSYHLLALVLNGKLIQRACGAKKYLGTRNLSYC